MLRPVSLLPALVVVLATLLGVPAGTAQAAPGARAADADPLDVTIETLSSSEIPHRGPIRVTGSVTNRDEGPWQTINVYAFLGSTPITTSADLAEAAATPATTEVGQRIIDLGDPDTEYTIDELAPGETAQFSLTVPHRFLRMTDGGVYWFGVHALGEGPEGRLDGADGRARTFLPYVPKTSKTVDTSLVIPIRRLVAHAPDGSIGGLGRWTEGLSPGGALRSLVDLGAAAGSRPVSWLVDPAVVDAARRLAAGNPGRYLGPTVDPADGDATESPSPSPTPDDGTDGTDGPELTPRQQAAADAATTWLERLHAGLEGSEILALPYGDVDVAASAAHDRRTYRQARRRSAGDLPPWGLPTTPAVSSPSGYLDAPGLRLAGRDATVLLTDRMFGARAPAVAHVAGRTVGVTSSGAVDGGPGPDERQASLAMRQRIVSEAAIRLLTPGRKPLIAVFPPAWAPESASGFWQGLDLDWLNLTTVASAMQRQGTDVPVRRLKYPDRQAELQLDLPSFAATDALVRAGDTLQNLLTENDQVAAEVRDEAWTDLSYSSRLRPERTRDSADRSRTWIETRLRGVTVDAPRAVILSSGSGRFAATVTNTLDEPVSVKVEAVAEPPLRVGVPTQTIDLGADERTTVLLNASSSGVGIQNVTLRLTDVDGVPLGSSDDVPVRSNRVSNVIWLIVGTGIALLLGAIVVRLFRRVRAARNT
ncbi:DUF6049 family protein [Nocardioides aquiterrae]|uniref:DUF6049 family protein n=1 Tax=Nocardioides aquiterrae TaxID=203799 RepID=A0ABN1U819_9ACTN